MPLDYTSFTLVFEGDLRQLPNPFKMETPWGTPYAVCIGDALEESDKLREELDALKTAQGKSDG